MPLHRAAGPATRSDDATYDALRTVRRELRDLLVARPGRCAVRPYVSGISQSCGKARLVKPIAQDYPKMEELAEEVGRMFTGEAAYVTMGHPAFNLFDDMIDAVSCRLVQG